MKSKSKHLILGLVLFGMPGWILAASIRCHLTDVSRDEARLDCGLSDGLSVGDKGIIFYDIKIGEMKRTVSPASFTILNAFPRSSIARIDKSTGEIKVSYLAEVQLTEKSPSKPGRESVPAGSADTAAGDRMAVALALLKKANAFYESGQMDSARVEYAKILALIPDDPLAKSRIQEIDKIQTEQKRLLAQLDFYHASADSALAHNQYLLARTYAEKALAINANDAFAQSVLLKIAQLSRFVINLNPMPQLHPPLWTFAPANLKSLAPSLPTETLAARKEPPLSPTVGRRALAESRPSNPPAINAPESLSHPNPTTATNNSYPMVLIRGAEFLMGEPKRTAKFRNEMPQHPVRLDPYFIDKYEVTMEEYRHFVESQEHQPPESWKNNHFAVGEGNHPVTGVTWFDAEAYCRFAKKRLPTEAEWEFAMRGPSLLEFPWGDRFNPSLTNTIESNYEAPQSVFDLSKDRSPFGVIGLAGNVSEWTEDWYLAYPQNSFPEGDYGERFKVVRGGSYKSQSIYARAAFRGYRDPLSPADDIGFRCARSAGNGQDGN